MPLSNSYQVEIDKIDKAKWTEILMEFDDASIYQTWSYGEVRWGKNNLSHVTVKSNNIIVGMAQVSIKKLPILPIGIAYVPWGPIWRRKNAGKNNEIFLTIIRVLKKEFAKRKGLFLRIYPNVVKAGNEEIETMLRREGFRLNENKVAYRTLLLDLSPSNLELRKGLDGKWRNQLNAAERKGLKIIAGDSRELYNIFLKLQTEMRDRKEYIPEINYDEFGKIQEDLPIEAKMKIIICENEGEPVACTICSAMGNTGIYILGATGDKGMKLKGSYLLQWKMIETLKNSGFQWYDLGGINPDKNPGVYHFKAGLSGKDIKYLGSFDFCDNPISFLLVKGKEKIEKRLIKI